MNMNLILAMVYGTLVLGALGALFGAVLGFAAKKFAVEVDERQEAISECLPGANCGGCGFPGCGGYAAAVVAGTAATNCCAAGGAAVASRIAEIMGVKAQTADRMVAQVACSGGGVNHQKYEYVGLHDCQSAARIPGGGPLSCQFGCLGLGTCQSVCPFDAIHVKDGVAVVDDDKCKACKKCVDVCPRNIIALAPYKTKRHVAIPCSSKDKGAEARKVCENGCIACGLCVKSCPKEAIVVENNLAKMDYDKCIGCGICAQKCPRKLITVDGKVPVVKAEPPKTETPKVEAPKADRPKVETPKEEAPKAEMPKVEPPKEQAPKAETPKTQPAQKQPSSGKQPAKAGASGGKGKSSKKK